MQEISASRQMVSLEDQWCIDTCCFHFLFLVMFSDIQFVVIQVRELQLELACKNGVLKAMKLTSMVSLTHLQPDEFVNEQFREPYFSF